MIMKFLSKPKENFYRDNSMLHALFTIYLLTVIIAAFFIIPVQEEGNFFVGLLKAFAWPLYLLFS